MPLGLPSHSGGAQPPPFQGAGNPEKHRSGGSDWVWGPCCLARLPCFPSGVPWGPRVPQAEESGPPPPAPVPGHPAPPARLSVADTCFPPPRRLSKAWEQRVISGLAFPLEVGPGSVLSPEALSLVLGAGVGGCQPSLHRRGRRPTWDPRLFPHPWWEACPQRGSPVGGCPQACFLSQTSLHPRGAGGETEAWGPSGPGSLPAPTPSPDGSASSGAACSIFRPLLEGASHLRPEAASLGLPLHLPSPSVPREVSGGGWGGGGRPGHPLPSWPHHSRTPRQAPAPPDSPSVGGGNSRESPRPLTQG